MSIRRSVVKWFDAKKGYGFIVHPEGGNDIFVHYSAISTDKRFKTLRTGQVVEFELNDGPKGLHAHNVVPEYSEFDLPVEDVPMIGSELGAAQGVRTAERPFRSHF